MEGLLFEAHENIFAIWESVYDEALYSDRYHGKAMVTVDYDALNRHVKDWGQIKRFLQQSKIRQPLSFGYGLPFIYLDQFLLFCRNGQK